MSSKRTRLGVEVLLDSKLDIIRGQRVGLVCNQASVLPDLSHVADVFGARDEFNLTTLFGPQHGIRGDVQDNMIETPHVTDKRTGKAFTSFVGQFEIPTRHGMTTGELARLFNEHFGIGCDLEVVSMEGWRREMYFEDTGLPWVLPSPNIPTVDTCVVFPAAVHIEGTEMSEGRGTTKPFELNGAPYIDPWVWVEELEK